MKKVFPSLPLNINNLESPKEKIKDSKNIIMAGGHNFVEKMKNDNECADREADTDLRNKH